jgi:hypothetical protein
VLQDGWLARRTAQCPEAPPPRPLPIQPQNVLATLPPLHLAPRLDIYLPTISAYVLEAHSAAYGLPPPSLGKHVPPAETSPCCRDICNPVEPQLSQIMDLQCSR